MTRAYLRLLAIIGVSCFAAPLLTLYCTHLLIPIEAPLLRNITLLTGLLVAGLCYAYWRSHARIAERVDRCSDEFVRFLDSLPEKKVNAAIFLCAALSLYFELVVIRWQGTVFEFFAFYKNFSLIACFTGLGLGYALAGQTRIPLLFVVPLTLVQILLMLGLRYGMGGLSQSLQINVFLEQLSMGLKTTSSVALISAIYFFLGVIFISTTAIFVPIGQLCGRLMARRDNLSAYGLNLLGSIAGVVLISLLSFLWTPPVVWFAVALAVVLYMLSYDRAILAVQCAAAAACLIVLAWPVTDSELVYSPYQLLEFGPHPEPEKSHLLVLKAAGHYYQGVYDLSDDNVRTSSDPDLKNFARYYGMPYRVLARPPRRVAVVGAGTGNDVAAALRHGAQQIDAVEIDPAIVQVGIDHHPEKPYQSEKVAVIVDDARTHLRNTDQRYDLIVYGLLDSHTLLSHASSVRIDSFVYTVEAFREARARLADGGCLCLSFTILSQRLGRKLYLMLEQAFDGHPPMVIYSGYDGSAIFLQSKEGDFTLPDGFLDQMNRNAAAGSHFKDERAAYADPTIPADVSTDDWPFFYMPQRVYPKSYLVLLAMILALGAGLVWNFFSERPDVSHVAFFFLGAGFMLIETKGITELGLVFGNTWMVIGVMIVGILLMAWLANGCVQRFGIRNPKPYYALLAISLIVGFLVARSGGFPSTTIGKLAATVVLTCPMFFSGLIFSAHLAGAKNISSVMAINLLGAICGGLLEYNSMYFGFQFLYLLAIAIYAVAFVSSFARTSTPT